MNTETHDQTVRPCSLEEIIEREGQIAYPNVGDSMWPLIRQGKDLVIITRKPQGRLKRYDIPLYRRDSDRQANNGKYVLHRILHVRKNDYLITGDNRWNIERGITDRHIVGVLTAVVRCGADPRVSNPRTVRVTDPLYRIYTHLWCDLFPLRAIIFWLRDLPGRVKRSLGLACLAEKVQNTKGCRRC